MFSDDLLQLLVSLPYVFKFLLLFYKWFVMKHFISLAINS